MGTDPESVLRSVALLAGGNIRMSWFKINSVCNLNKTTQSNSSFSFVVRYLQCLWEKCWRDCFLVFPMAKKRGQHWLQPPKASPRK